MIPAARSFPGASTARGAKLVADKRPEAQGGRTPWFLRLAIMRALLVSAARAYISK
jgi:hypothetical protein